MSRWDDTALWDRYWAADGDVERKEAGAAIVDFHRRFLYGLSNELAFASWSPEWRQEFAQEVFARAIELLPKYDPNRGANFLTFLRTYMRQEPWKFAAAQAGRGYGRDTVQVRAGLSHLLAESGVDPDRADVDALIGSYKERHGTQLGKFRVLALVTASRSELDERTDVSVDPADVVVDRLAALEISQRLADALASVEPDLGPIEREILASYLDDEGGETLSAIGLRHGVTRQAIGSRQARVLSLLRSAMGVAA